MKIVNFVFFVNVFVINALAGGIMSISGQKISCEDDICKIKVDKAQIYQISLKKLSPLQQRELSTKKKGDVVSAAYPMNAIVQVEDVK